MLKLFVIWLHRYVGITFGVLVVLATVTGSLAVFAPEIDQWANPALFRIPSPDTAGNAPAAGAAQKEPLETFTRLAVASYPDQPADFRPAFATMRLPLEKDESVRLLMIDSFSEPHGPWWQVYGNPQSGEALAARTSQDSFAGKLVALHIGLFLGEHSVGTLLIGIGGILTLGFAVTGLYLWWPGLRGLGRSLKVSTAQGSRKFWLDLHKVTGVLILAPLLVLTITGLFYVFPQSTRVPLEQVLDIPAREGGAASTPLPGSTRISVDRALAAATRVFPQATATTITIPFGKQGSFAIRKRFPGDLRRQYSNGNAMVWVDQYSGEVLKAVDERSKPVLTRLFHDGIFPLHSGEILGLTGRWLAFLVGMLPLGLFVSGIYCWWKIRSRKQQGLE